MLKYENEYFGRIRIDESGELSGETAWRVTMTDHDSGGFDDLRQAVQTWAGAPGDPLKVPAPGGKSYTNSADLVVTGIELEPVSRHSYRVTFACRKNSTQGTGGGSTGSSGSDSGSASDAGESSSSGSDVFGTAPVVGSVTESRTSDGALRRKALWKQPAATAVWPTVGSTFYWTDGLFLCESCDVSTGVDQVAKGWVTAREASTAALGPVTREVASDGIATARRSWYVANSSLPAFLSANAAGGTASWAGSGYLNTGSAFCRATQLGCEVTLTAREISTRRLSTSTETVLTGYDQTSTATSGTVTTAVYQVKNSDLGSFNSLVGSSSAAWTGQAGVIVKVTPKTVSAWESCVEIQSEPAAQAFARCRTLDDSRETVNASRITGTDMVRFYLTAAMAGYRISPDGRWEVLPGWEAASHCPLTTSDVLPERFCEAVLKCLTLTETTYLSGNVAANLANIAGWAQSRVYQGSVGGLSGSYLKLRQSASESLDREGNIRTKLVRTYELAPANYSWNASYWASF